MLCSAREPFILSGHWLVDSQIDMQPCVEVAVHLVRVASLLSFTHIPFASSKNRKSNRPVLAPSQAPTRIHVPRFGVLNIIPFSNPLRNPRIYIHVFRC